MISAVWHVSFLCRYWICLLASAPLTNGRTWKTHLRSSLNVPGNAWDNTTRLDGAGTVPNMTALSIGASPFTVCAMGDSITAGIVGFNSTTYTVSQGFRGELASRLKAKGAQLVGYQLEPCPAIEGATSYVLGQHLRSTNFECGSDNGPIHPDMVLMLVGINDLMQGLSPGGSVNQVKMILESLWKVAPRTQVLLASIFGNGPQMYVSYYNEGLMNLVHSMKWRNHPIEFVPMQARTKMCSPDTCDIDMIHPNHQGYEKMADVWWEYIKPHLPR